MGHAPSPNLKAVRSKIGSLDNATYKPGGGNVKIESKKIDIKAGPRIEAKNDKYMPKGGEKKVSPVASFEFQFSRVGVSLLSSAVESSCSCSSAASSSSSSSSFW